MTGLLATEKQPAFKKGDLMGNWVVRAMPLMGLAGALCLPLLFPVVDGFVPSRVFTTEQ